MDEGHARPSLGPEPVEAALRRERPYLERLARRVTKNDYEDVAQDVIILAWQKQIVSRPWLCKTLRNRLGHWIRRQSKQPILSGLLGAE